MNEKTFSGKKLPLLPVAFAIIVIIIIIRYDRSAQDFDNSILFLITLAVLIIVLPWERLRSFRAAGVELELDKAEMKKAFSSLELLKGHDVDDKKLSRLLEHLSPQIEQATGSRILWIDDTPNNVLGERRLLRALGIETIMANSSEMAEDLINADGDFNLIISDMRSRGSTDEEEVHEMPEAVRFLKELRDVEAQRMEIERYAHIPSAPVIIYSAKSYTQLLQLTEPIRRKRSVVILAKGVEELLEETLRTLSYVRSDPMPIVVGPTPDADGSSK